MALFQGAGFSIELPEQYVDASSYVFAFPSGEPFSPNLTIRFQELQGNLDPQKCADDELDGLKASVDEFALLSQQSGKRGASDGVMSVFEWGKGAARVRQKQVVLLVNSKPPKKFVLTATCLASQAEETEPVFNQVLASFQPE